MPRYRAGSRATPFKRWIIDRGLSYKEVAGQLAVLGWPVSPGHVRNVSGGKPISSLVGLRAMRKLTGLPESELPLAAPTAASEAV